MKLKDKVAIITGAQRGIGFAIAERFVEEGAYVVLADIMAVNLRGVFLCSRAEIPHMEQHGHGIIINVASELGLVGAAGVAAYCASKGGAVMLSKAMAIDHGPEHNCSKMCSQAVIIPPL